MSSNKLVWSDDPRDKKCPKCGEFAVNCECRPDVTISTSTWTAVFRLEKSGRGGKTVTVIDKLPRHETFAKELCKELKNKCGTGGTYLMKPDGAIIEIQGDKRDQIKKIFDQKGIKYKGM